MKELKRSDLEDGLSAAIIHAAELLEDLHVCYHSGDVKEFLSIKVGNTTLAKMINSLYKIVLPGLNVALLKLKNFSKVFDWAAIVVRKLFA